MEGEEERKKEERKKEKLHRHKKSETKLTADVVKEDQNARKVTNERLLLIRVILDSVLRAWLFDSSVCFAHHLVSFALKRRSFLTSCTSCATRAF